MERKMDKEKNIKESTKWGRSADEWEDHWKEVYNLKIDDIRNVIKNF